MSDNFVEKIFKTIKRVNMAIDNYKKIGKVPAIPYRAFVNYADYFFMTGCFEQAEELLKSAENFVSVSSDAIFNHGALKQTKGELDEAILYYQKTIEKDPKNTKAICFWGNCLSLKKDYDGAIEKYKEALEIDNKFSEAFLYWGINLLKKNDAKNAREKFEKAVQYDMKDVRALFMLASVETELEMYDNALDKFKFIIAATENNYGAYHNLGYIYFKKKEYNKTIKYVKKAIDIMPLKLESYLLLGDTYLIKKEYKQAIKIYKKSEENNVKSMFLYLSWGSALQKMNNHSAAIEKFIKAFEYDIALKNIDLYTKMAESYLLTDNLKDARFNIDQAVNMAPDNLYTRKIYADILVYEGDYDKALNLYTTCLKNTDIKSEVYLSMAKCYKQMNNIKLSKNCFEQAIEYDNKNINLIMEYIKFLDNVRLYDDAQKKLLTLENMSNNEYEVLSLVFKVNYNIAKEDFYGYNRMKAIKIADKIKKLYPKKFVFNKEYEELMSISRE